jgi:hypothetical protein
MAPRTRSQGQANGNANDHYHRVEAVSTFCSQSLKTELDTYTKQLHRVQKQWQKNFVADVRGLRRPGNYCYRRTAYEALVSVTMQLISMTTY